MRSKEKNSPQLSEKSPLVKVRKGGPQITKLSKKGGWKSVSKWNSGKLSPKIRLAKSVYIGRNAKRFSNVPRLTKYFLVYIKDHGNIEVDVSNDVVVEGSLDKIASFFSSCKKVLSESGRLSKKHKSLRKKVKKSIDESNHILNS